MMLLCYNPTRRFNVDEGNDAAMDGTLRNMTAVYIHNNTKLLLLYRIGSQVVPPSWCGIGGNFEKSELNDARAAALRELEEEIGLTDHDITGLALRYITLRLKNGEVRQNYYFFCKLKDAITPIMECVEGKFKWVEMNALPYDNMPHTARAVLKHYMEIGKYSNILYSAVADEKEEFFHELKEF